MHSQLVVLGGGPGGYAAASRAADKGMEVTLVDAEPRLGGTTPHQEQRSHFKGLLAACPPGALCLCALAR